MRDTKAYLKKRVEQKSKLIKRMARLQQKTTELFLNNDAVKRYVAISHLRDSYVRQLRDLERSIENVACRLVQQEESDVNDVEETSGSDAAKQL